MNRVGRATLMFIIGAVLARLVWSGGFGWFVQQHMRLPLVAAAAVLLAFAVSEGIAGGREEFGDPDAAGRSTGPVVGWLLMLPIVVLLLVAPTGLGAAATERVDAYAPTGPAIASFPPLDPSAGAVDLRVYDFVDRAVRDEQRSLDGVPIRLEGLVVNDPEVPDGFLLTRFLVSCCAADGIPVQVAIVDGGRLPNDTWVIAEVVWDGTSGAPDPDGTPGLVRAEARSVTVVTDPPNSPYESP